MLCGAGRRALRPAGRHHQPQRDAAVELDRDGDLGGGRRARHAGRRGAGRLARQRRQELADGGLPVGLALRAGRAVRRRDAVLPERHRQAWPRRWRSGCAPLLAKVEDAGASGGTRTRGRRERRAWSDDKHRGRAPSRRSPRYRSPTRRASSWCCGSTTSPSASTASRRSTTSPWCSSGRAPLHHRPERRRQDHADGRHHRQDPPRQRRRLPGQARERSDQLSEYEIAALGIGRKFQRPTVFQGHTVFENCELALARQQGRLPHACSRASARPTAGAHRRGPRAHRPRRSTPSGRPACSPTARSSGSRSACCWRRTRRCCWSTSRSPA